MFRGTEICGENDCIGSEACPIFYQYVTDDLIKKLIKSHFSVEASLSSAEPSALKEKVRKKSRPST